MTTSPPDGRRRRASAIGLLIALVLAAVAVYSAMHGLLIGVLLAGFAALLFLIAVIDNRYFYASRPDPAGEGDAQAGGDGVSDEPS